MAIVIGDVRDVSRFPGRDHYAAYNSTAPIEVSSGPRKVYRLSRRRHRRLNHAIHMAAITQIRHRHSNGRAYYDKKLAEGQDPQSGPLPHCDGERRRGPSGRLGRVDQRGQRCSRAVIGGSAHQRSLGVLDGTARSDPVPAFGEGEGRLCRKAP